MTKTAKKRAIRRARDAGQPYQAQQSSEPRPDLDLMLIEPPGPLNWTLGAGTGTGAGAGGGEGGTGGGGEGAGASVMEVELKEMEEGRVESVGEVRRRHRAEAKREEKAMEELARAKARLSARDKAEKAERRKITKAMQARRSAITLRHSQEMAAARARRDKASH